MLYSEQYRNFSEEEIAYKMYELDTTYERAIYEMAIEEMSNEEFVEFYNEFLNDIRDYVILHGVVACGFYPIEYFEEFINKYTPYDAAMMFWGNKNVFSFNDDYFTMDAYGNLESCSAQQIIEDGCDESSFIEWFLENYCGDMIDDEDLRHEVLEVLGR